MLHRIKRLKEMINPIGMYCGIAFIVMCVIFPAGTGYALFGFEEGSIIPDHFPKRFDGAGRIDRMAVEEVVIGDRLFVFSPDVVFHTQMVENASSAWFKVGCLVGFLTDENNKITSMYLIKER